MLQCVLQYWVTVCVIVLCYSVIVCVLQCVIVLCYSVCYNVCYTMCVTMCATVCYCVCYSVCVGQRTTSGVNSLVSPWSQGFTFRLLGFQIDYLVN